MEWRTRGDVSAVLCDRKIPMKLKGKVYKTVVRLIIPYKAEAVSVKKKTIGGWR